MPQGDVEDEEDLALLEARDLLFARLLQYRAFKGIAGGARGAAGGGVQAAPAVGRAGGAVREPAARGADRHRPRPVRGAGGQGARAQAGARGRPEPHPRHPGERPRAGRDRGRAAASTGRDDVPGAVRRLAGHADHGGAVPLAARAVPRGGGRLRPGDPARRADGPLDRRRRRGRRGPGDRRVRGCPAGGRGAAEPEPRAEAEPRRQNDDRDRAGRGPARGARARRPWSTYPSRRCAARWRRC